MKLLVCVMLSFGSLTGYYYPSFQVQGNRSLSRSEKAEPRLLLETSINDQQYQVEFGDTMLRWNLTLTYKNEGTEPILLYKKSSLIYRSMISRSLKAASKGRYEEDTSSHYISVDDMRAAGFLDRLPEDADFVTLKPGESYTVQAKYGVRRRGNSKDDSGLPPGNYFIEMRVATWYFYRDPKEYREKRRVDGYLWSQNIKSEPMLFTVQ